MPTPCHILLSSAGPRVDRVQMFRATLDRLSLPGRILTADLHRAISAACHVADDSFDVPPCEHSDFIPRMLDICRKNAVRILVPTIDYELPVLAEHREQFHAIGTTVVVSTPQVARIGRDKREMHRWLTGSGFPTVRQGSVEEVLSAPDDWPFPLLAKPVSGCSSSGVHVVADRTSLEAHTKPGCLPGQATSNSAERDFILQTIAPGVEYTVDTLINRKGTCVCAVPRRRIEVRAGEVFKGVTVRDARLQRLAIDLSEALPGAYGPLNIQMFLDEPTGAIHVIEINARFAGGFHLSWEAGAKFPQWILEELLGRQSTAAPDAWQDGLVMLRYYDAVFTTIDSDSPQAS